MGQTDEQHQAAGRENGADRIGLRLSFDGCLLIARLHRMRRNFSMREYCFDFNLGMYVPANMMAITAGRMDRVYSSAFDGAYASSSIP